MIDLAINLSGGVLAFVGAYFAWLVYKALKNKLMLVLFGHALIAGTVRLLMFVSDLHIGIDIEEPVSRYLLMNYILFCWAMVALWQSVRHFILEAKKNS